jgi:hypothetical protein
VDLDDEPSASVRVTYTTVAGALVVLGVFRLDDDSEVDFDSLAPSQQHKIEEQCENEVIK